jgi:ubiquinone/menaquinone biosynthesis C-methylase UbiE
MSFNKEYFNSGTYTNVSFARYHQYWWSNRFYAILARRYGRKGGYLLEVGSGLGHLVAQLECSFKTTATDINWWALEQSSGITRATDHIASSANLLPYKDGAFDVIIIKHVVEHLVEPDAVLKEIYRVTATGGIVLLSTPNLDSLLKPLKGKDWIGFRDPTHISLQAAWMDLIKITALRSIGFFRWILDAPYVKVLPILSKSSGFLGGIPILEFISQFVGKVHLIARNQPWKAND